MFAGSHQYFPPEKNIMSSIFQTSLKCFCKYNKHLIDIFHHIFWSMVKFFANTWGLFFCLFVFCLFCLWKIFNHFTFVFQKCFLSFCWFNLGFFFIMSFVCSFRDRLHISRLKLSKRKRINPPEYIKNHQLWYSDDLRGS